MSLSRSKTRLLIVGECCLVCLLLAARLNRKVGLSGSDFFALCRIAVLSDQVTREACQHDISLLALGARPDWNHFMDIHKMVSHGFANLGARRFCLVDERGKVLQLL